MPTLAAFYKKINLAQEGEEIQTTSSLVDYAECLGMLRESLVKNSPGWNFTACTDETTQLDLPVQEIFRSKVASMPLMESLVKSNTDYVQTHPGQSVLCGVDHLVAQSLAPMFQDQFDITLLLNGDKINNTVVMINTTETNHNRVVDFFNLRQSCYDELDSARKQWLGDQVSFELALQHWGFIDPLVSYSGRSVCSNGLTVKFITYNQQWVHGVKKKSPSYTTKALFLDFKGPRRKQWFNEVYQRVIAG